MYQEGDYEDALNQFLFRAFISLEKYEVPDTETARFQANEVTCKILKLMYVCLKLQPGYLDSLQQVKDESEVPKLELQDVLFQIAADIQKLEFFNVESQSHKPSPERVVEQLDRLCYMFKYSSKSIRGKRKLPSKEEQKKYVSERLEDFEFDFMPKESNIVYHVVSMEWFKQWQRYVGIEAETKTPGQDHEMTE